MIQTKKGNVPNRNTFKAVCRGCGAEYEAARHELNVERCPREQYEFAHYTCKDCKGSIIFYLKPL